jgi:hypothetical protein
MLVTCALAQTLVKRARLSKSFLIGGVGLFLICVFCYFLQQRANIQGVALRFPRFFEHKKGFYVEKYD